MNLKRRKLLYYFFALIFLVWGAYLIVSTQGFVFDWEKVRLVKTGGVYLKFIPSDAIVSLNGEAVRESPGILNRGVLIDDLIPDTYHVAIEKKGTVGWEKDLNVLSGIITSASNIRLWNISPTHELVATATTPYFSPVANGTVLKDEEGNLTVYGKQLRGDSVFAAKNDSKWIITETEKGHLFFTDTENPEGAINLYEIFNSLKTRQLELPGNVKIRHARIHPFSDEKVIIATEQSIYSIDLKRIMIEKMTLSTSTMDFLVIRGSTVFGISKDGFVQGTNLLLKNNFSFVMTTSTELISEISIDDSGSRIAFEDTEGSLFLYDRSAETLLRVGARAATFALSSDGTKLIWMNNDKKIFVYYAEKDDGDLKLPKGSVTEILVSNRYKLGDTILWIPAFDSHAFIKTNGSLLAVELDPRGTANTATIIENVHDIFLDDSARLNIIKKEGTVFSLFNVEIK